MGTYVTGHVFVLIICLFELHNTSASQSKCYSRVSSSLRYRRRNSRSSVPSRTRGSKARSSPGGPRRRRNQVPGSLVPRPSRLAQVRLRESRSRRAPPAPGQLPGFEHEGGPRFGVVRDGLERNVGVEVAAGMPSPEEAPGCFPRTFPATSPAASGPGWPPEGPADPGVQYSAHRGDPARASRKHLRRGAGTRDREIWPAGAS